MNKLMCANGHFYDGDMYSTCPHCEGGMEAAKPDPFLMKHHNEYPSVSENTSKEKRGFFHRKKVEDDSHTEILTPDVEDDNYEKTEIIIDEEEKEVEIQEEAKSVELSFNAAYKKAMAEPVIPKEPAIMKQAISSPKDLDEGKTIGFFSTGTTEPPVGYLICIKGEDYGTGFALKSGNNSIGRSQSMDVVILDAKVSREKQAFVMYEPHKRDFYLKPGEGTGLCYLNDDILLEIQKLKAYDKISLGDSELLFIPVCGEQFSWE